MPQTIPSTKKHRKKTGIQTSPWIVIGAAFILLVIVMILAVQNINREKHYMSQILKEKGAALIRAVEAGARTGMMGMMWGEQQIQQLFEETARQPDILYLAVTDTDGKIFAHSNRMKIGETLQMSVSSLRFPPSNSENWQIVQWQGRDAFEVYRFFRPLKQNDHRGKGHQMHRRHMMNCMDWCSADNFETKNYIIFAGFDIEPFESAHKEDIRNTVIISVVLILLGFAGFVSLFWAQGYKATNKMLRDTSAFADEVVASLPVGLIATDREGRIAFFNGVAEKITGIRYNDARGKDSEAVLSAGWCGLNELIHSREAALEEEMECTFSGEKTVPLSVSASRIINEDGQLIGKILILKDLGEIRRLEEEIRRKEKLAAIGGLAAGVAHEIRNPLSSIKGIASYFGNKSDGSDEDKKLSEVMVQEVDRLNRAVSGLLDFAKPAEMKLRPVDIRQMLEHSIRLVQQDADKKQIDIRVSSDNDLPLALLDRDRFSQCLLNLYLNAIQAMDNGGILTLRSALSSKKNTISIEIEDTGRGIQPNSLKKIFDPYFTTKNTGTGLGLAIVHKIIEAHQGNILVRSTPGKGTLFIISVPAHTAKKGGADDIA